MVSSNWWMYSDSRINSSHGWWPSLQGGDTPTHGITWKNKRKKEKKVKSSLFCKKGLLSAKQPGKKRRVRLFDPLHESDFSQETMSWWKQMLLLLHGVLVHMAGCYVFTLSPRLYCAAGNVWTMVFSTCHKIRVHSLLSGKQNNPCSASFKPLLGGSQPPSTPTPSNSSSTAKGTPPKIWKKTSDGGCFCVAHSLLLPLFSRACYLSSKHSSDFALNPHSLASVKPLLPLLLKMEGKKVK